MKTENIRTRFAPSPTGFLHVGGLRTALFNYLLAKKFGGQFILRIEDTDQSRLVDGALQDILKSLKWAGLDYDEGPDIGGDYGPYVQSERTEKYKEHAKILLDNDSAYYCFCTSERLDEMRANRKAQGLPPRYDRKCSELSKEQITQKLENKEPHVIRFKIPDKGESVCHDLLKGEVKFNWRDLDDFVLLKSDGFPTYHLANIVDDHEMKITHVIRGEEWLSSLPKHELLYSAFGWDAPEFAHLPLLLSKDKKKLSKRQGDVAVGDYIEKGYLPEALLNFVVLLGWNPGDDREIFTLEEMVNEFTVERLNKSGSVFDLEKLEWMNAGYIKAMDIEELTDKCIVELEKAGIIEKTVENEYKTRSGRAIDTEYLRKIIAIEKDRIKNIKQITDPEKTGFFFEEPEYEGDILVWKKMTPETTVTSLKIAKDIIEQITGSKISKEVLRALFVDYIEKNKIKTGELLWPLRVSLTGLNASPDPFEVAEIIGKESVLRRIDKGIELINN